MNDTRKISEAAVQITLECLFEKYGQADYYNISMDSGRIDSESYLKIFEDELIVEEEEEIHEINAS